jgi:hypothetical protein
MRQYRTKSLKLLSPNSIKILSILDSKALFYFKFQTTRTNLTLYSSMMSQHRVTTYRFQPYNVPLPRIPSLESSLLLKISPVNNVQSRLDYDNATCEQHVIYSLDTKFNGKRTSINSTAHVFQKSRASPLLTDFHLRSDLQRVSLRLDLRVLSIKQLISNISTFSPYYQHHSRPSLIGVQMLDFVRYTPVLAIRYFTNTSVFHASTVRVCFIPAKQNGFLTIRTSFTRYKFNFPQLN